MSDTDLNSQLQKLIKLASYEDKLSKGLHEVTKALESSSGSKKVDLCILAEDCDNATYKTLVSTLCKQYKVPLLKVASRKELGQWCGLCKFDISGTARKVRGCSAVVIREFCAAEEAATAVNIVKQVLNAQ